MTEQTWIDTAQACALLGVGPSRLRSLAREHPTRLGHRKGKGYRQALVLALAKARGDVRPSTLVDRVEAAEILGVGLDRFNQIAREHPTHLGRRRTGRKYRTLYSRAAVTALKTSREGARAPAYPKRGSALRATTRGQQ
jgi:hypothetical protein